MRNFVLTEKAKDHILNITLVCSLLLLAASFNVLRPEVKREGAVPQPSYALSPLQPLEVSPVPAFEEAPMLPPVQSNTKPDGSGSAGQAQAAVEASGPQSSAQAENTRREGRQKQQAQSNGSFFNNLLRILNLKGSGWL